MCTPDFFLFDGARQLVYRGRLDDAPREPQNVTSQELRAAIQAVLAGKPVAIQQNASMGCSIKWKPGNEPE
ncbi:hypothetical protein [Magnetofaba australis]|uniref:hypothetical protein n=1 Tax=Magnetofaba australis TaxID=1472297 RepID=UPI0018E9B4C4|nr:hypothetical protein [Magnetofaba australis]